MLHTTTVKLFTLSIGFAEISSVMNDL